MTDPEVVVYICPGQATTPEAREALAELARAAVRAVEAERAAMTPERRAAHDEWRRRGRERLDRIRRRAAADERGDP